MQNVFIKNPRHLYELSVVPCFLVIWNILQGGLATHSEHRSIISYQKYLQLAGWLVGEWIKHFWNDKVCNSSVILVGLVAQLNLHFGFLFVGNNQYIHVPVSSVHHNAVIQSNGGLNLFAFVQKILLWKGFWQVPKEILINFVMLQRWWTFSCWFRWCPIHQRLSEDRPSLPLPSL